MSISGCESMNAAQGDPRVRQRRVRCRCRGIQQGLLAEEVRVELPGGRLDIARKVRSSVIHDWSGGTYLRRIYPFMKQPEEELQETLTELDDRAVVDYLRHHPEFLSVTPMPWKRCVFHIPCGNGFAR